MVYAKQLSRSMLFHPLPAPSNEDIARLARAVRIRFSEGKMGLFRMLPQIRAHQDAARVYQL